jgi:hypothetical protein
MVVPSTVDGFRAAVSALQSLDGKEGVSFHIFTLPENRSVRLLVKNLGRVMIENVVEEEVESLNILVRGVTQLLRCLCAAAAGHKHTRQPTATCRMPTRKMLV